MKMHNPRPLIAWHPVDQVRLLWWLWVNPAPLGHYLHSEHRHSLTKAGSHLAGALLLWPLLVVLSAALAGQAPPANSIAPYVMLLHFALLVMLFIPTVPEPPPDPFDEDFALDSLVLLVGLGLGGGLLLIVTLLGALVWRGAGAGVLLGLLCGALGFVAGPHLAGLMATNIEQGRASWLARGVLLGGAVLCGVFVIVYMDVA